MCIRDSYVPMVDEFEMKVPFSKAKEIVKKGLAPLGKEYGKVLSDGMESGWIDVYENEGKRSGAYSWGAYGCHPFAVSYTHLLRTHMDAVLLMQNILRKSSKHLFHVLE